MTTPKIELYKMRDFGQKLNATIEFIRANFKKLFTTLLFVAGPTALIMGIVMKQFMGFFMGMSANPGNPAILDDLPTLFTNYFVMFLVSIFASIMLSLTTYAFMELYSQKEALEFSAMDVLRKALSRFGSTFLLTILVGITLFISVFFFFLPALYFGVVLSLAIPILYFEKVSPVEAYRRAFTLIKDKWWSTFGLLFISVMISYVVSMIFSVPFYAVYMFELVGVVDKINTDPSAFTNIFSSWYMAISMVILGVGGYLSYSIPLIALGFQYFNLAERNSAPGLINKIQDFENIQ
ncbi:hypothetical protein RT717_14990 [Imperialibacter roseus]|uniref:Integral membrane protein n=1 Tax=Imperialibacter roseus TaxID=1324217 RepID=A0ABZ0IH62_9BACT|nr:hypothetical protein [Imperialibacter roseus]WOK04384.1 hypothetical protein RT717_14990 [Imperialibacter roseus]